MDCWDVIIAGAGLIGVSLALELHERGAHVLVLDQRDPGAEASSAAAGMLAPTDPGTPPALRPLAMESARLYPEFVRTIESLSGMETGFRRHGTVAFLKSAAETPSGYSPLSNHELHRLEPNLQSHGQAAFSIQEDSVDPRLLMRAALAAAQNQGVEIRGHTAVTTLRSRGDGAEVDTAGGVLAAGAAVNCRGAWAGAPVRPRKGQMLYLQPQKTSLLQHVVHAPEVYIVPRSSGKILVGATVEDRGFDKTVEAATIHGLAKAAARYLPELESATTLESWAGLRPGTPDDLPLLGPTDAPGIFIAGGHFRNGILLAPITAKIMADLITRRPQQPEITPFSPARFGQVSV
jgi:glycine oxidase